MTTHELAARLLDLPNVPVVTEVGEFQDVNEDVHILLTKLHVDTTGGYRRDVNLCYAHISHTGSCGYCHRHVPTEDVVSLTDDPASHRKLSV